jgi:hypothetical protein
MDDKVLEQIGNVACLPGIARGGFVRRPHDRRTACELTAARRLGGIAAAVGGRAMYRCARPTPQSAPAAMAR